MHEFEEYCDRSHDPGLWNRLGILENTTNANVHRGPCISILTKGLQEELQEPPILGGIIQMDIYRVSLRGHIFHCIHDDDDDDDDDIL